MPDVSSVLTTSISECQGEANLIEHDWASCVILTPYSTYFQENHTHNVTHISWLSMLWFWTVRAWKQVVWFQFCEERAWEWAWKACGVWKHKLWFSEWGFLKELLDADISFPNKSLEIGNRLKQACHTGNKLAVLNLPHEQW